MESIGATRGVAGAVPAEFAVLKKLAAVVAAAALENLSAVGLGSWKEEMLTARFPGMLTFSNGNPMAGRETEGWAAMVGAILAIGGLFGSGSSPR